jgi:3-phosphoshikimate 1-carboxyvinyltransferase
VDLSQAILIRPLTVPVAASISVPGSKSLTNRSLVLAALSDGTTELRGALWSEDTELMVNALQALDFDIKVQPSSSNPCNRTIFVKGGGGKIPASKADIDVGTAGTVARFIATLCALGKGSYKLHGTPRMHERPMDEIFAAIRTLGGKVTDDEGHLPAVIDGPIHSGKVSISDKESTQFASAFLLIADRANVEVECSTSPYVEMTKSLLRQWKTPSMTREIEPDASSASYFFASHFLHSHSEKSKLTIESWPSESSQIDHQFPKFLPPPEEVSRKNELGDSVMTLVITAAALRKSLHLKEAGNLRKQECDRISALKAELKKCGVPVRETTDGLILSPSGEFKRARIETYHDHRMAMCFAVLGLMDVFGDGKPWVTIENPSCVSKTFPNFFETLDEMARQSYQALSKPYPPLILKA